MVVVEKVAAEGGVKMRPKGVFVIAEIGSVHDGSFGNAKQAALLAKECGADAVKYQVHIPEAETLRSAPSPFYFAAEPRWDYFRRTGFTPGQWAEIKAICDGAGIEFMASPFSEAAVDLLRGVGMKRWKIPSGEVTNLPMLRKIAALKQSVILSSGMSSWEELDAAFKVIRGARGGRRDVMILQCSSEYPCPYERVGLNLMEAMAERYGCPVGLSDHSKDIFAPIAAVAKGAVVIEKHLTFSRAMYGSDARHSLEPQEFRRMVEGIRATEILVGTQPDKDRLLRRYRPMKRIFEKSIVYRRDLEAGVRLRAGDLDFRKPGTGVPAAEFARVIGRTLRREVRADRLVAWGDLEPKR